MLCLIIKLTKHSTIYFNILFGVSFLPLLSDCIYLFNVLNIAVDVFMWYCAVIFGLMTTRLNKYYYYYYYYMSAIQDSVLQKRMQLYHGNSQSSTRV